MANKKCLNAILKKYEGKEVDAKLLGEVLDKFESIKKSSKEAGEYHKRSKQAREKNQELAEFLKERLATDLIKRKERFQMYEDLGLKNWAKRIEGTLMGVRGIKRGALLTRDRAIATARGKYESMITMGLEDTTKRFFRTERIKLFKSGKIDLDIARGLAELRKKVPKLDKLNISEDAKIIAKVIRNVQDEMLMDGRAAGLNIKELEGFIMSQTHDYGKIRGLGSTLDESFDIWAKKIMPLLNQEKTFPGVTTMAQKLAMLRKSFDDIANGKHNPASPGLNDTLIGFKDIGPAAKKLEGARKLHFDGPDQFHAYNLEFGKGNFAEGIMSSMNKYAKTIPLVETFGVEPKAAFEADLKRIESMLSGTELEKFKSKKHMLQRMYDTVSGESDIPADNLLGIAGGALRAWQSMSKLGRVIAIAATDLPQAMGSVTSRTGENMFSTTGSLVKEFITSFPPSQRRMAAEYFGLMANDMMGVFHSRIDAGDDALPGAINKAMRLFFKMSGLSTQTEMARTAISITTAKFAAKQIASGDINISLKRAMNAFDIQDADLKFIKNGIVELYNGQKIIDIREITRLDGSVEARKAAEKMRNFIIDMAETGSPQPTQKEKFLVTRGTKAGTIEGEALRSVLQFKSVPIKMLNTMRQIWDFSPTTGHKIANTTATMAGLTAMAYAADTAVRFTDNKKPEDPFDPEVILKSIVRGGSGGLYADFFLGKGMNFGSATDTLAGPVIGEVINRPMKMFNDAKNGKDIKGDLMNWTIRNSPGNNLFYLKPALEYGVYRHAREMADRKKERRKQKRLKKERVF